MTIQSGARSQPLSVTDWTNSTFEDNGGGGQVQDGAHTLNGTSYPSGTNIEAEYVVFVEDSEGNPYTLQFVSLDYDAYNIQGFVVQGAVPPFGAPLTITSTSDVATAYAYTTSAAPACFAADARIETRRGPVAAGQLRIGDWLALAGGGETRLRLVLAQRVMPSGRRRDWPVRLRAGTLGPGLPGRDLVLSPQHRVAVPGAGALIPARALTKLPRVGLLKLQGPIAYVHLVTARHSVILAEGLACETFWPGPEALKGLPPGARRGALRIMGPQPVPAMERRGVVAARERLANA